MTDIVKLYEQIISAVGWVTDKDGQVSSVYPGSDDAKPVIVDKRRLVLPTPGQLKIPNWDSRYAFHPLLQSAVAGESLIMDRFTEQASKYGNFVMSHLFVSLTGLAIDKEKHKDLSPIQARYLRPLAEADQTFLQHLMAIIKADIKAFKNQREYVRFMLIKGRTWQGQKRNRVAYAHFSVYQQLIADDFDRTLAGVKLRVKDVKMLKALYEFIFPGIEEAKGTFDVGSDSKIAPSMEALMAVYSQVFAPVNKVFHDLQDVLPGAQEASVQLDFLSAFDDMQALLPAIRKIPLLDGNTGKAKVVDSALGTAIDIDQSKELFQPAPLQVPQYEPTATATVAAHQPVNQPHTPRPIVRLGVSVSSPVATAAAATPEPLTPTKLNIVQGLSASDNEAKLQAEAERLHLQRQRDELQQRLIKQQQAQAQAQHGQELPPGSRIIHNQVYVPLSGKSVNGALPAGSMVIDGVTYVPQNVQGAAGAPAFSTLGAVAQQQATGLNGIPISANGQIDYSRLDPASLPGVDPATAELFRVNPTLMINYVQNLLQQHQNTQLMQQPQQQVPRYLRVAAAEARLNQQQAQQSILQQQANLGLLGGGLGVPQNVLGGHGMNQPAQHGFRRL